MAIMSYSDFIKALEILEHHFPTWQAPVVQMMAKKGESPYRILITTILSLRSRDERTAIIADQLFHLADTPEDILKVDPQDIRKVIFSIGFYDKKTQTILDISQSLLDRFDGQVPKTQKELLSLPGVGLKTANLVLATCFGVPHICVDVHVHRICNRWGFVHTNDPIKTERALSEQVPDTRWWPKMNYLIVGFGQTICKPLSPFCSRCPVYSLCHRIDVARSR